jgi:ribosomal protein S18 acetylase RimI-like enzyme
MPPDGITIEPVTLQSLDELAPLWAALLDHVAALPGALVPVRPSDESWPLERQEMLAALAGDAFALVARRDGRAVGYAYVVVEGPDPVWYTGAQHAYLAALSVAADQRRCGVGGALLDAVDEELERRGVEDVEIGVDTGNDVAAHLYEGRGYRPDFRIFYGSPGRKPWACLRREAADRRAGRGRFAPPGPPGTPPPSAAQASESPAGGARHADAGPVHIHLLPPEELDRIEPLWRVMQADHTALWHVLEARDPGESWALRRRRYADWLTCGDSFIVVAERGGRLVGYFMVAVAEGDESFATGERMAELSSLVVLHDERGEALGERLFQAGMRRLEELGVDDVISGVLTTNTFARRFHDRHGFVPFVDFLYAKRSDIQAAGGET